jgi:hypothetical protein
VRVKRQQAFSSDILAGAGHPGMSEAGSLGHIRFAEDSTGVGARAPSRRVDSGSSSTAAGRLSAQSNGKAATKRSVRVLPNGAHVRFKQEGQAAPTVQQSAVRPSTEPARPRAPWSSPGMFTPGVDTMASGEPSEAEAAMQRSLAAAALIAARQAELDMHNAQLYQARAWQHRRQDVDWSDCYQVPGDPWQPHQRSPVRVGILSRSLVPCTTRLRARKGSPRSASIRGQETSRPQLDEQRMLFAPITAMKKTCERSFSGEQDPHGP